MRQFARTPLVILNSSGAQTRSLSRRAAFLQQIKTILAPTLPAQAGEHLAIADYSDGVLVLIVDSGTWATRLRYQKEVMRRALAQQMRLDLDHIEIRVRPAADGAAPAPRYNRRIPQAARQHLSDSARYVGDAKLAAALVRLARCGQT